MGLFHSRVLSASYLVSSDGEGSSGSCSSQAWHSDAFVFRKVFPLVREAFCYLALHTLEKSPGSKQL